MVTNRNLGSAVTAALAVTFLVFCASALQAQAENAVGLPLGAVPDPVQLEDLDGNTVDLSAYVGSKPVLVEFWATWCEICRTLEPKMVAAHRRFGDQVEFLMVAVGVNQNPRSIRRHLEGHAVPFRFLYDRRGRAARAFRAPTTAYVAILDAEGRVAYTGVGADQDLEGVLARLVGDS
jgi:thiol-disulfide isomerase/thioredoxin